MNILDTIATLSNELGTEKLLETLAIDMPTYSAYFYKGKRFKAPSYEVCQKVFDIWESHEHEVKTDEKNILKAAMSIQPGCDIFEKIKDISHASIDADSINALAENAKQPAPWEGRDVCLCIPVYGSVSFEFFFTVGSLIAKYRDALWLNSRGRDSMIARSRNHLAKRFLDTKAAWSIWLDSDMCFPMGHAGIYGTMTNMQNTVPNDMLGLHTIDRLLSWKRTVVGGCYWDRSGGGRLIAGSSQPIIHSIPSNNLQAVDFVGTGCLAVHRQVFLDIAAKFPETMDPSSLGNECGFFTPIQTPQRMLGEDESFAKRATDAGHPSYLDLGLCCGHMGSSVHGMPAKGSRI